MPAVTSRPENRPQPQARPLGSQRHRILYVDHTSHLGGGEIALINLIRCLDPEKYEPVVLLFSSGPVIDELRKLGTETHVLELDGSVLNTRKDSLGVNSLLKVQQVWDSLLFSLRVLNKIKQLDVEIVHCNSLKADVITAPATKILRIPTIWHVRDQITDRYLPPAVARVFRMLCQLVPDYVIANSHSTLSTIQSAPGAIAKRTQLAIWDGVDLERFENCGVQIESPMINIALIGRISPWKGQDVFIRAAGLIAKKFPHARFLIAGNAMFGEHEYEQELHRLVDAAGLADVVRFVGFCQDIPAFLQTVDIVVHASTIGEPFGLVVVEAMAACKPLIATRAGGVPEIVEDGVSGILVKPGDHEELASALESLIQDPHKREGMSGAARRRAEQFSNELTAGKVEKVYETIFKAAKR